MALPNIFGTTPQNTQRPGADLDTNFNAIGATGAVPCTASGANAITLTPFANNITIGAYANFQLFSFQAAAASTGAVTLQVGALAALPLFQSGGIVQAGNGTLASGQYYLAAFQLALNGGAGGFVLVGNTAPAAGSSLLQTQTVAGVASVDFTSGIDATFNEYLFVITSLVPATNAQTLLLEISQDAGVSWKTGAGSYRWAGFLTSDAATNSSTGSTADTKINLAIGLSNTASNPLSGEVRLFSPASGSVVKPIISTLCSIGSGGNLALQNGGSSYVADGNAINGIRFIMSAGNITSATISLFGIRK